MGLRLSRPGQPVLDRQGREKLTDVLITELGWMTEAVEPDKAPYPTDICSLVDRGNQPAGPDFASTRLA